MGDGWVDAGASADLDSGSALVAEVDALYVRIVRVAGTLYAFEDRCTHDNEPLDAAEVDTDDDSVPVVICPRHGARFCLRDGAALTPPAYEPIRVFAVRERAGRIEVNAA
jgi:3-phenylpropionate/trans-cinnamate dioxygenase ferredoxin subunit